MQRLLKFVRADFIRLFWRSLSRHDRVISAVIQNLRRPDEFDHLWVDIGGEG